MQNIIANSVFTEASKYAVVGAICTLLDISLLYCLTHFADINYLYSSVMSFIAGAILNYFFCTIWIFKISRVQTRIYEFYFYMMITVIVLAVNTGLMWLLTSVLNIYFLISKLLSVFFTYGLNFSLRKWLLHTVSNS